jgi:hypothetical protein
VFRGTEVMVVKKVKFPRPKKLFKVKSPNKFKHCIVFVFWENKKVAV